MNEPDEDLLDARLRAAFSPPSSATFTELARRAVETVEAPPSPRLRFWPWLLAAAALLLTLGLWATRSAPPAVREDGARFGAMWAAAYEQVASGKHANCCDARIDFCGTCERRFAVKLTTGGCTLRGCYCGPAGGGCVAAFVDTEHGPVGVFALRAEDDPRPALPAGSPLRLTRRELGPLVLYGVARGEAPLDRFALQP